VMVSVPSVPRRLRAFVTSPFVTSSGGGGHVTGQVRVDLRWSRPAQPAGNLVVSCLDGDQSDRR